MYGVPHALPLLISQGGGVIANTTSSETWMGETEPRRLRLVTSGSRTVTNT
jgi:hypothetical protein